MCSRGLLLILALLFAAQSPLCAEAPKPKAAIFPFGGSATDDLRKRCGFALRTKLDRDGTYEVIDGYTMADAVQDVDTPINFDTPVDQIKTLAKTVEGDLLIWGQIDDKPAGSTVRLRILDLREKDAQPRTIEKVIAQPTDMRFVTEAILAALPGVKPFEHPNETSVTNDPKSLELWAKNPNLMVNGSFAEPGHWMALYMSQKYPPDISDSLPAPDQVCIYHIPAQGDEKAHNVLAMNLSENCAENNGMACLSDAVKIEPGTRYRLSYRYKSDGPTLHVFVKGYSLIDDIHGQKSMRESYRRQVPPSGGTGDKWVTVIDDANPQNPGFPVAELRVDLYAYLSKGTVMFDDVILKAVGAQTDVAKDDAIKAPMSRPAAER